MRPTPASASCPAVPCAESTEAVLRAALAAMEGGEACVVVTLIAASGSIPRSAGAKALVRADGSLFGTIGGGRFESLVRAGAMELLGTQAPVTRTYPLHENSAESFGAVCGGEATVLFEPHGPKGSLVVVGAGHCGRAIARLALSFGWGVTVVDDRAELLDDCPATRRVAAPAPVFVAGHRWRPGESLVLVSRNHELDRDTLGAALRNPGAAYVGMMGSRRKVRRVFGELREAGIPEAALQEVRAPIGLDIGAESPAEIAVSVVAEILRDTRRRGGQSLSAGPSPDGVSP